jgi:hypothetical protein
MQALPAGQGEIDVKVKAFLDRPIGGEWPYIWVDDAPSGAGGAYDLAQPLKLADF